MEYGFKCFVFCQLFYFVKLVLIITCAILFNMYEMLVVIPWARRSNTFAHTGTWISDQRTTA